MSAFSTLSVFHAARRVRLLTLRPLEVGAAPIRGVTVRAGQAGLAGIALDAGPRHDPDAQLYAGPPWFGGQRWPLAWTRLCGDGRTHNPQFGDVRLRVAGKSLANREAGN